MTTSLNEFTAGKADVVADKIFSILSRRTGITFKTQKSLIPYYNKWGKFLGKFAFSPDGKCFRLNFLRNKTDEAVSLEYWAKEKDPYKQLPDKIFSFEGYGVTKLFFQIEAFVKGNFKIDEMTIEEMALEGMPIESFKEAYLQEETVKELFALYAADNPAVITNIAKGGFDEVDMFAKLKVYIGVKKLKVAGFAKHTLAAAIKSYLKKVAKGEEISSIPSSLAGQAAAAVPSGEVFPGTAAGVNTVEINIYDALDPALANKINNLIAEINDEKGVLGVIRRLEEQILIAASRNVGARLVVACGRAGTGKSRTIKRFLQYGEEMGLSPGSGYIEVQGMKFDDEDDVTGHFCKYKDIPILLFDDSDQLFISKSTGIQNIMKHVLDPDRENRTLTVEKDLTTKSGKLPAGDYTIDCKLIWCTNKGLNDLTPAIADRMMKPANIFNFTDQEVLDFIKEKLSDVCDEHPELTQDEIFEVFMFFQAVVNELAKQPGYDVRSNKEVSFRTFKTFVTQMETLKMKKKSFNDFWKHLADTFHVKVEKPAKIIADM